ncbi:MAG: DNA-binding protein [Myxococcales bacterium]|nr:DNA-binding protein [Myxococcales bacterium]
MDKDHDDEDVVTEDNATEAGRTDPEGEGPPALSRKVRQKRRTRARSKTIAPKRLTKEEILIGQELLMPDVDRPRARGQCKDMPRPCPFVSCKHHLYLDVNQETGSIKLNFPDIDPWEMRETCSLDVADRGGITLEEVGEILNLTRERIRQVEVCGLLKLKMGNGDGENPLG